MNREELQREIREAAKGFERVIDKLNEHTDQFDKNTVNLAVLGEAHNVVCKRVDKLEAELAAMRRDRDAKGCDDD